MDRYYYASVGDIGIAGIAAKPTLAPLDPAHRHKVYPSMDLNFRLKANFKAIDAGLRLPTIKDDFTGKAPDLGALEFNQREPHYGPRWITWKPLYR